MRMVIFNPKFISQYWFLLTSCSAIMSRVKEHPEMTYINVGLFAKSGFALPIPVLEQFWKGAESWEKPFEGVTLVDQAFEPGKVSSQE
jgi:hypothetical protein